MAMMTDEKFMKLALEEAALAPEHGDVPVGAVLVDAGGNIVSRAHNRREQLADPAAHAEMIAITKGAAELGDWRLDGYTLYVTLEPCVMCAGAIMWARIDRVVYGAPDFKAGAAWSLYNVLGDTRLPHQSEITHDVLAEECSAILSEFFEKRRSE